VNAEVVCIASWNADLTSRIPRPLARGETLMASDFTIGYGGKGSNASVACARQGARTAVIARIGCDAFGTMALQLWADEGIDASNVEQAAAEPSGVAQILVYDDGDNSIAVAPGAGAGLGEAQVHAARAAIAGARVVMASCEVPLAATQAAFAIARAAGVTTLLNPAPACPLPDAVLALTDVLTPNEAELQALVGPGGESDALLARGVRAVIATRGAAGCTVCGAGGLRQSIPGCRVERVVDTVGAGDTFTGALAAALAGGASLVEAATHANAAAALSVTGRGAIGGMPTRAQTLAFLRGG
jgi:ribokinase